MHRSPWLASFPLLLALFPLTLPFTASAQSQSVPRTLTVEGHSGNAPVLSVSGRSCVSLEALARVMNGSLSFRGSEVVLSLGGSALPPSTAPDADHPDPNSLSREFMKAGI